MGRTTVSRTIQAPVARVFGTISDIENFSRAVPDIVRVEFLTGQRTGPGTRFRETRRMGKREVSSELEVKELVANDRVRMVSDQGGTVWDTVFTVRPAGDGATDLTLVMDANAYKLLAKIFNPLIKGMIRKFIEKDLDAVKAYCEGGAS